MFVQRVANQHRIGEGEGGRGTSQKKKKKRRKRKMEPKKSLEFRINWLDAAAACGYDYG